MDHLWSRTRDTLIVQGRLSVHIKWHFSHQTLVWTDSGSVSFSGFQQARLQRQNIIAGTRLPDETPALLAVGARRQENSAGATINEKLFKDLHAIWRKWASCIRAMPRENKKTVNRSRKLLTPAGQTDKHHPLQTSVWSVKDTFERWALCNGDANPKARAALTRPD